MKRFLAICFLFETLVAPNAFAQITMSSGVYSQNFDSLGSTGAQWTNNATFPGWYAAKNNADSTNYLAGAGVSTTGGLYSFGTNGINSSSDRALGSIASGSASPNAYGVRFTNDTALAQSNIVISYTGEQWRIGSAATTQTLAFSYAVTNSPITNAVSAASWINFAALNFNSPATNPLSSAIDGNATANRQTFASITLSGVTVPSGQELFLRWLDVDDTGTDHGLALDDLTVAFAAVPNIPPSITAQPTNQSLVAGATATFIVSVTGTQPLKYQWNFDGVPINGATNSTLTLDGVSTDNAGIYSVNITNIAGSTNSASATLDVTVPQVLFSLLTYNVKGNGATNWDTNSPQIQAIGRIVQYLNPDIITFNEIPNDLYQYMTNFVITYLPGYYLGTNSGTDGFIRSVVASRYPIVRTNKWLDGANLQPFGYTNNSSGTADNFTRDLFEAQISVPGLAKPVHVFTTHLKSSSGDYTEAALKRAAEAAAITNFFATNFFPNYSNDLYTLSGDMNEDNTNTLAIQRLVSAPTGLQMMNPLNPATGSADTYTSTNPSSRLDYIFPCAVLSSNVAGKQVFRSDKIGTPPPPLLTNDSRVASDHLPVFIQFSNPSFDQNAAFKFLFLRVTNQTATLKWQTIPGRQYALQSSTNLSAWSTFATNITAIGSSFTLVTNVPAAANFFRVYRSP